MDILFTLLVIAIALLAEGFFSGSEIGVVSADQIKLRHEAAKGSKGAALAIKMLEKPEWLLSTTLVGTNISVVTNTTMATALMIQLFGDAGSWLAVALAAPLIWVFGEIVPKSVFQQRADTITPYSIFALKFFSYLFYPILIIFSFLTRLLARLAGDSGKKNPFTARQEIVTMLQMPAVSEGDIDPVEQNMIRRLFDFTETTVQQAMLPLIEVVAIEKSTTCGDARRISAETSHARLPVYDKRVDRVVGILHTLDLLGVDADTPIRDFIRTPLYVPLLKSIKDLLIELRREGEVVAVVVDEFGAAEGIITVEDIMEEVVEDLEDEYDVDEDEDQWVRKLGERDYLASARIELDQLCEKLKIELPVGNYETLAGLILEKTRDIPDRGKVIEVNEVSLTVQKCSARAIQEVRIRW